MKRLTRFWSRKKPHSKMKDVIKRIKNIIRSDIQVAREQLIQKNKEKAKTFEEWEALGEVVVKSRELVSNLNQLYKVWELYYNKNSIDPKRSELKDYITTDNFLLIKIDEDLNKNSLTDLLEDGFNEHETITGIKIQNLTEQVIQRKKSLEQEKKLKYVNYKLQGDLMKNQIIIVEELKRELKEIEDVRAKSLKEIKEGVGVKTLIKIRDVIERIEKEDRKKEEVKKENEWLEKTIDLDKEGLIQAINQGIIPKGHIEKVWEKLLSKNPTTYDFFLIMENGSEENKKKAWKEFLKRNPDRDDFNLVMSFCPNYKEEAEQELRKLIKNCTTK